MRILVLTKQSPLGEAEVYGADLMCRQVVEHLRAQRHQVTILAPEGSQGGDRDGVAIRPRLVRDRPDPDLPPEQWRARHKLQFLLKARHNYLATRQALREARPAVVYVSDLELLTGSPLRAVQEAGVPMVFHAHDLTLRNVVGPEAGEAAPQGLKQTMLDWFLCPFRDRPALLESRLLAVSQFMADEYRRAGWRAEAIRVVYNGIDERFFREARRDLPAEPSILVVGRCVPDKGLHVAVEALGRLAERGLRVKLELAGTFQSAAYEAQIRDLAAHWGVAEQVAQLGYVASRQMPEVYDRQVCTWVPSLGQESFGLVSVESQARGTPVIVSATGGLPETLQAGVTGLVVPEGDAAALAEATERLLTDEPAWRAMSEAGREFASCRFPVARMVAAVEESLVDAAG